MRTDIFLSSTENHHDSHRRWGADTRVRFNPAACLPVRYPGQECGLCVPACPASAISMDADAPRLQGDCLGCGQCAVACPTSALSVDGFALPAALDSLDGTLHIDCWRVPFAVSPRGALRVPCLAGIGVGWLLALFDLAGTEKERPIQRTIRLLDRGACAACPAGAGMDNLRAALDEARTLLDACGIDAALLPRIQSLPAKGRLAPAIPTLAAEIRMDRRGFFRGLMGSVAKGVEQIASIQTGADAPIVLRGSADPIERMRSVTALASIAARHGMGIPAQALPQLSLAACDASGVCASTCPTGALTYSTTDTLAELTFMAARCIACGQCARLCPEQAIRVSPSGGTVIVEVLARWSAHECLVCGESFFGADSNACPACTKSQQLYQGMAAQFQPSA